MMRGGMISKPLLDLDRVLKLLNPIIQHDQVTSPWLLTSSRTQSYNVRKLFQTQASGHQIRYITVTEHQYPNGGKSKFF